MVDSYSNFTEDDDDNRDCYKEDVVRNLRIIYIIGLVVWAFLIYFLGLFNYGLWGWAILAIPVIAFLLTIFNMNCITKEIEANMCKANVISIGLLSTIILVNWNKEGGTAQDKKAFFRLLIIAFIFLISSLVDLWLVEDQISYGVHFTTILQSFSLALLAIALYSYYLYHHVET